MIYTRRGVGWESIVRVVYIGQSIMDPIGHTVLREGARQCWWSWTSHYEALCYVDAAQQAVVMISSI